MEDLPTSRKNAKSRENTGVAQSDLRRVRRALEKLEAAREAYESAIRAAAASGESHRDIAEWANLSKARIQQIVKKGADDHKRGKNSGQE